MNHFVNKMSDIVKICVLLSEPTLHLQIICSV